MIQEYIAPIVIAALMTCGLTYSVKKIAEYLGIFDEPGGRKILCGWENIFLDY